MAKNTYDKIPEELKKIKDEAVDSGSELVHAVDSGYEALKRKKDAAVEKMKDTAFSLNKSVHSNPWPYIGGAAFLGLVVGRLMRRS